jgi:hypothetical protein
MGIDMVEDFFITGLNGSGQKIAVGDSGLDDDHGDFNGRISGLDSVTPGDSSTADPSDGHGTHVACTVLGDGMRSSGTYQGVAPEADLYFQAMEDDDTGANRKTRCNLDPVQRALLAETRIRAASSCSARATRMRPCTRTSPANRLSGGYLTL